MRLSTVLAGKSFEFKSIKEVLAKANEAKSGDQLAGIAATSDLERVAAKAVLSRLLVRDLRENPVVSYEDDEVTRINQDSIVPEVYDGIKNWSIAELREYILDYKTTEDDIRRLSTGLTAEVVAGVCKLMSNLDLVYGANKVRVTATCNTTIGRRGCLSTRLQPNHSTDDVDGITASLFEGLSYGCGDALLGLNPVNDTVSSLAAILVAGIIIALKSLYPGKEDNKEQETSEVQVGSPLPAWEEGEMDIHFINTQISSTS